VDQDDRILVADLLNEIFHLPIDWDLLASADGVECVAKTDVQVLLNLLERISPKLQDKRLLELIWAISQVRKSTSSLPLGELMSSDDVQPIREHLRAIDEKQNDPNERFRESNGCIRDLLMLGGSEAVARGQSAVTGPSTGQSGYPIEEEMDHFFHLEEVLLRDAGLDQASTGVVLRSLRRKRSAIVRNLREGRIVYLGRYERAIDVAVDEAKRVLGAREVRGLVRTKKLRGVKDKVVGLATIWSDVIPLVISGDWGMAGVWSCVAGATAASMMAGK